MEESCRGRNRRGGKGTCQVTWRQAKIPPLLGERVGVRGNAAHEYSIAHPLEISKHHKFSIRYHVQTSEELHWLHDYIIASLQSYIGCISSISWQTLCNVCNVVTM